MDSLSVFATLAFMLNSATVTPVPTPSMPVEASSSAQIQMATPSAQLEEASQSAEMKESTRSGDFNHIDPVKVRESSASALPLSKMVLSGVASQFKVRSSIPNDVLMGYFTKYAEEYHVDRDLLITIARCESTFNPMAVNGPYGGMFQFLGSTWSANRRRMGLDSNPDLRFDAEEAIRTAAYKISIDGAGAWPVCSKVGGK